MNKELKALERIGKCYVPAEGSIKYGETYRDHYKIVEQALTELQAIKEANPSEAFEETKLLRGFNVVELKNDKNVNKSLDIIQHALLKAQEQEKENAEYQKVLKILFEKKVDIYVLMDLGTLEEYNEWVLKRYGTYYQLTEEDFDLLKRYFK